MHIDDIDGIGKIEGGNVKQMGEHVERCIRLVTICCVAMVLNVIITYGGIFSASHAQISESVMGEAVAEVAPKIALTFDDGPSDMEGGTEYLLDGLAQRGVQATFFVLGSRVEANPMIMTRLYEEGHLIGNHTYSHVDLSTVSDEVIIEELTKTNEIIEEITGEAVLFMRPPYGSWNEEDEELFHMIPVLWTVDSLDWTTSNVEEIVNKVVTDVEENDIILMHDCYQSSAEAAFQIIDILQEEGYEFVTVDELLLE